MFPSTPKHRYTSYHPTHHVLTDTILDLNHTNSFVLVYQVHLHSPPFCLSPSTLLTSPGNLGGPPKLHKTASPSAVNPSNTPNSSTPNHLGTTHTLNGINPMIKIGN